MRERRQRLSKLMLAKSAFWQRKWRRESLKASSINVERRLILKKISIDELKGRNEICLAMAWWRRESSLGENQ
jgi:hypothetical protein